MRILKNKTKISNNNRQQEFRLKHTERFLENVGVFVGDESDKLLSAL
jgi:uncharacterized membrane protein